MRIKIGKGKLTIKHLMWAGIAEDNAKQLLGNTYSVVYKIKRNNKITWFLIEPELENIGSLYIPRCVVTKIIY